MNHFTSPSASTPDPADRAPSGAPTDWYATYGRPPGASASDTTPTGITAPAGGPTVKMVTAPRPRIWLPVTTAATGAALAASLLTASLTGAFGSDRKSTRLNSSHVAISYAVFCLKKKTYI